jgi:Leucine-rich repeat (LRR) protein
LYDNHFSGPIPEQLENLTVLQQLLLSNNSFSGSLPMGLANLLHLTNISLYDNHLSGPLPSKLGMLSNLTVLDVTNNAFNGTLPTGLCQNSCLRILDIQYNNFDGPIPMELRNCGSLVRMRAGFNSLTSIPNYFGRNSNLQYLELSSNYLHGALPLELGLGSALSTLKLDNNRFFGNLSSELVFSNLPNLQVLNLSSNQFVGPIPPSLVNCTNLFILDLSYNFFNGSIPQAFPSTLQGLYLQGNELSEQDLNIFTNLSKLNFLNMAQNNLRGLIPQEIGLLNDLQRLNLSYNQFSGTIPVELGNLQNVQVLDLSHNQLSGTIPPTLGTQLVSLESVNVSYNDLNGSLPSSWIRFLTSNYDSFVGNPGLCLIYSRDGQCSTNPLHSGKKKITTHVVVAIVVSSIVFILGFGLLTYCYFLKSSKDTMVALSNIEVVSSPGREISFNNIMEATQNLSSDYIIGIGGHGTVYKAIMFDGSVVAVKKIPLLQKDLQIHKSFLREINTIGNVKHRNLAKLLGFCKWGEIGLLIYDYIPNGDLHEALHNKVNGMVLNWDTRLKIAEGIAHGLAYLHHDCVPPIIHRDIKSRNVLLDANLEAHIVDFGIAKTMSLKPKDDVSTTTVVEGTYGYIAPGENQDLPNYLL